MYQYYYITIILYRTYETNSLWNALIPQLAICSKINRKCYIKCQSKLNIGCKVRRFFQVILSTYDSNFKMKFCIIQCKQYTYDIKLFQVRCLWSIYMHVICLIDMYVIYLTNILYMHYIYGALNNESSCYNWY